MTELEDRDNLTYEQLVIANADLVARLAVVEAEKDRLAEVAEKSLRIISLCYLEDNGLKAVKRAAAGGKP